MADSFRGRGVGCLPYPDIFANAWGLDVDDVTDVSKPERTYAGVEITKRKTVLHSLHKRQKGPPPERMRPSPSSFVMQRRYSCGHEWIGDVRKGDAPRLCRECCSPFDGAPDGRDE